MYFSVKRRFECWIDTKKDMGRSKKEERNKRGDFEALILVLRKCQPP